MKFKKGGGKERKTDWKWGDGTVEEVKEFTYLGYRLKRNGGEEEHIKEMARRGNILIRQVWGIGERRLKEDFRRRVMLFDYLIMSVLLYGAKVWGWNECEKLESIQEKYLKWTLGLDTCTPRYMVLKETKRDQVKIKAGARAQRFEDRIKEGEGRKLLKACLEGKGKTTDSGARRQGKVL